MDSVQVQFWPSVPWSTWPVASLKIGFRPSFDRSLPWPARLWPPFTLASMACGLAQHSFQAQLRPSWSAGARSGQAGHKTVVSPVFYPLANPPEAQLEANLPTLLMQGLGFSLLSIVYYLPMVWLVCNLCSDKYIASVNFIFTLCIQEV